MVNINDRIDELELAMMGMPPVDCPVTNSFVPGYYIREVTMPEGALITSQIHNTEHPYHVSKGVVHVKVNEGEWITIEAPCFGITQPGTRRVLYVEKETKWATFHPILENEQPEFMLEEEISEAIDKIGKRIIQEHVNPLIGGVVKNNILTQKTENQ